MFIKLVSILTLFLLPNAMASTCQSQYSIEELGKEFTDYRSKKRFSHVFEEKTFSLLSPQALFNKTVSDSHFESMVKNINYALAPVKSMSERFNRYYKQDSQKLIFSKTDTIIAVYQYWIRTVAAALQKGRREFITPVELMQNLSSHQLSSILSKRDQIMVPENSFKKMQQMERNFAKSLNQLTLNFSKNEQVFKMDQLIQLAKSLSNLRKHFFLQLNKKSLKPLEMQASKIEQALFESTHLAQFYLFEPGSFGNWGHPRINFRSSFAKEDPVVEIQKVLEKNSLDGIDVLIPAWLPTGSSTKVLDLAAFIRKVENRKGSALEFFREDTSSSFFLVDGLNYSPQGRLIGINLKNTNSKSASQNLIFPIEVFLSYYSKILELQQSINYSSTLIISRSGAKSTTEKQVRKLPQDISPPKKESQKKQPKKANKNRVSYKKNTKLTAEERQSKADLREASRQAFKKPIVIDLVPSQPKSTAPSRREKREEQKRLRAEKARQLVLREDFVIQNTRSEDSKADGQLNKLGVNQFEATKELVSQFKTIKTPGVISRFNSFRTELEKHGLTFLFGHHGYNFELLQGGVRGYSVRISKDWRLFFAIIEHKGEKKLLGLSLSKHHYENFKTHHAPQLERLQSLGYNLL
ncbi:MAG: hypothetical protein AB8E15_08725 [Bdellovibrionales bacterium]